MYLRVDCSDLFFFLILLSITWGYSVRSLGGVVVDFWFGTGDKWASQLG